MSEYPFGGTTPGGWNGSQLRHPPPLRRQSSGPSNSHGVPSAPSTPPKLNLPPGIQVQRSNASPFERVASGLSSGFVIQRSATSSPSLTKGFDVEKSTPRNGQVTINGGGSSTIDRLSQLSGISIGPHPNGGSQPSTPTKSSNKEPLEKLTTKYNERTTAADASTAGGGASKEDDTNHESTAAAANPRTYRPLVKHFDPNSTSYGFDLSRVKMERASPPPVLTSKPSESETSALPPPSFHSRRSNQQQATTAVVEEKKESKSPEEEEAAAASGDGQTAAAAAEEKDSKDDDRSEEDVRKDVSEPETEVVDLIDDEEEVPLTTISVFPGRRSSSSMSSADEAGGEDGEGKKKLPDAASAADGKDATEQTTTEESSKPAEEADEGKEGFKKPKSEQELQSSSPVKRKLPAEDGGGGGDDFVDRKRRRRNDSASDEVVSEYSDGHSSSNGCTSSWNKAAGSTSLDLAQQQQYYAQQLAYYQNTPMVGRETVCIFCLTRCSSKDKKSQLLACLHSACFECFRERCDTLAKENKNVASISLDDDAGEASEVVVKCPLCTVSSTAGDVVDNLFLQFDDDQVENEVATHICQSCDDQNIATSYCNDCEEHLCEDCIKAHHRVKVTKDHRIMPLASSSRQTAKTSSKNLKDIRCRDHENEMLEYFCESCDLPTCRQCQLMKHPGHVYRLSSAVVPEIRSSLLQSVSDIRLKRNALEQNRSLLGTKLSEVDIKEKALLTQLIDVKNYLVTKIESKFNELRSDVSKVVKRKRTAIEGRKGVLNKLYLQADYALSFADFTINQSGDDYALVMSKKAIERHFRRLKKLDASTGLNEQTREIKMDLYFQQFSGQHLHSSLESVMRQVMNDVKVLDSPPTPPSTPTSTPASVSVSAPNNQQAVNAAMTIESLLANAGLRSPSKTPQKATPKPSPVRKPAQASVKPPQLTAKPSMRGMSALSSRGRGSSASTRGTSAATKPTRGSRGGRSLGARMVRGAASSSRGAGGKPVMPPLAGRGKLPATAMSRGGGMVPTTRGGRGKATPPTTRGGRGSSASAAARTPRTSTSALQPPPLIATTPTPNLPPGITVNRNVSIVPNQPKQVAKPNHPAAATMAVLQRGQSPQQQWSSTSPYFAAAYGGQQQYSPQQMQQQQQRMRQQQQQLPQRQQLPQHRPQQQQQQIGFNGQQQPMFQNHQMQQQLPAGVTVSRGTAQQVQQQQQQQRQQSATSWHTPQVSQQGPLQQMQQRYGPTPPQMAMAPPSDNSFKITLPSISGGSSGSGSSGGSVNSIKAAGPPEVIGLDAAASPTMPTLDCNGGSDVTTKTNGESLPPKSNSPTATAAAATAATTKATSSSNVKDDFSDDMPDLSSLLDAENELMTNTSPADWMKEDPMKIETTDDLAVTLQREQDKNKKDKKDQGEVNKEERHPTVSINDLEPLESVKLEHVAKREEGEPKGRAMKKKSLKVNKKEEPESKTEGALGGGGDDDDSDDWCAVCHDGGELYGCERCPRVFHLSCYIPPLTEEPPDDWACLMCATVDKVNLFPNKIRKKAGDGKLGQRDLTICRRLLFELYNVYPESYTFKDASDLNFAEYRAKIKEPIALNEIREKLHKDHEEQYSSVAEFLRDVRKMFHNCRTFHSKEVHYYKHAERLEEILDKQLVAWLPEYAYDTYDENATSVIPMKRRLPADQASTSSNSSHSNKKKKGKKKKRKKPKPTSAFIDSDESVDQDDSLSEGDRLDFLDEMEERLESKSSKGKKMRK